MRISERESNELSASSTNNTKQTYLKKNYHILKNLENEVHRKREEERDTARRKSLQREKQRIKILGQCKQIREEKCEEQDVVNLEGEYDTVQAATLNVIKKTANTSVTRSKSTLERKIGTELSSRDPLNSKLPKLKKSLNFRVNTRLSLTSSSRYNDMKQSSIKNCPSEKRVRTPNKTDRTDKNGAQTEIKGPSANRLNTKESNSTKNLNKANKIPRSKSRDATSRNPRNNVSKFYGTEPRKLSKSPSPILNNGFPGLKKDIYFQNKVTYESPKMKVLKANKSKSPTPSRYHDENKNPYKYNSERSSKESRSGNDTIVNESQGQPKLVSINSKSRCDFMDSTLPSDKSEYGIIKEKIDNQLSRKQSQAEDKKLAEKRENSLIALPAINRRAKSSPKTEIRKAYEEKPVVRGQIPHVTTVDNWIKRNKLPTNTKVFIISQGYKCIRDALQKRNWVENPHFESNCFHFKYTLKSRDLGQAELSENQIVNHFSKASNITTKVGLLKTLNHCVWNCSKEPDIFFPRCYDTNDDNDYQDFSNYYMQLRTECYLKKFVMYLRDNAETIDRTSDEYIEKLPKLEVALNVNKRRCFEFGDHIFSNFKFEGESSNLSEQEQEIFSQDDMNEADLLKMIHAENVERFKRRHCGGMKKKKKKKAKKNIENKDELINNHNSNLKLTDFTKSNFANNIESLPTQINDKRCVGSDVSDDEGEDDEQNNRKKLSTENRPEIEVQAIETLCELYKRFPQTEINGSNNIWIVKPAKLSRGRGIKLYSSWTEINRNIKNHDTDWIVQKYIENPALIAEKKFDIRQWVMVTDWNPLTIWFYEECYIRFSASEFSLHDLKNRFVHLTNNSVNKLSDQHDAPEDLFWEQKQLSDHMQEQFGYNHFEEVMKPKMKEQVKHSLMSCQEHVENRKNASEIYGYDFCIDSNWNVWLIEINSSPAFDFSSDVTERLVKMASEDLVKTVIDYQMTSKKKQNKVSTGQWTRIHKSKIALTNTSECLSINLKVEGTALSKKMLSRIKQFNV